MENAIEIVGLKKSYGSNQVLHGIDLAVKPGEIFALLGINGAGKTTTLECMEGLRHYQQGTIKLSGKLGIQLQSSSLLPHIKALEAVKLFAQWQDGKVDYDYLQRLGVMAFKDKLYQELSLGQKRRLHLAIAMLGNPDIVVLDEPTAGLDVEGRLALHQEIRLIKSQGKTIIMASHDMAEVEELCDRIAIIKDGTVAFVGNAAQLRQKVQNRHYVKIYCRGGNFSELPGVTLVEQSEYYYLFSVEQLSDGLLAVVQRAKDQQLEIRDLQVQQVSLEQCFMELAR